MQGSNYFVGRTIVIAHSVLVLAVGIPAEPLLRSVLPYPSKSSRMAEMAEQFPRNLLLEGFATICQHIPFFC
jgi:hypothetical protein